MSEAKGKITVIAHVACNNTADSVELAAHADLTILFLNPFQIL